MGKGYTFGTPYDDAEERAYEVAKANAKARQEESERNANAYRTQVSKPVMNPGPINTALWLLIIAAGFFIMGYTFN